MLLSIVIPWHRNLEDLSAAVESVLAQDWAELELIVVANGVDDPAFAAVQAMSDDPRLRIERLAGPGAAQARNHGMSVARGELVFFLDADDVFLPGKLRGFADAHAEKPFDLAFSRGLRDRGNGTQWPMPPRFWDGSTPIAEFFFVASGNISTSALVVSADAARRLRFNPDATPYEDPDFVIQAAHLGMDIRMLPATLYRWSDWRDEGRLSRGVDSRRRLAWAASLPAGAVSQRARAAFGARCVAQHVFPNEFGPSLRLFAEAARHRAVPLHEIGLFMLRGLLPRGLKRRLATLYLRHKAVREVERCAS